MENPLVPLRKSYCWRQGLREGGVEGDNDPGAHGVQEAHGLEGAYQRAQWSHRADQDDTEKSVCKRWKTCFFCLFLRSHQNPDKIGSFSYSILENAEPNLHNI